jgi:chlorobactene glucosyltransferase
LSSIPIYSTLALLLGLYLTWLVHSRGAISTVLQPDPVGLENSTPGSLPLISVIIPARNETHTIRECLQAIFSQTFPNFEVIVVDDRSTDDTPRILAEMAAAEPRLEVIQGAELPSGWAGKPHALVQGVAAAHGEWLCFVDADTFIGPELLWSAYHQASLQHADLFSILTMQILGSFWERSILPLVFLGLAFGFPADRVNDPQKPDAIANGQFILIKRLIYDQVGGHAAVKDRIDEDRALAAGVKQAGFRLVLADGRKLARTRMYTSLPEMWEGWTKNIYPGLQGKRWLLGFGALLGLLVSLVLPLWLVGGMAWLSTGGGMRAVIVEGEVLVLWAYLVWRRLQACRYFNISGWYALTFPLGAFIFTLMMVASSYNVISGRGVSWKGRTYR